jgi:hypothetical protein
MVSLLVSLTLMAATARADDAPFGATAPSASTPGTPTPTLYPQVTVPPPPGNGGINRDSPLLPTIKTPTPPPKEPASPGLGSVENKARAPGSP